MRIAKRSEKFVQSYLKILRHKFIANSRILRRKKSVILVILKLELQKIEKILAIKSLKCERQQEIIVESRY